MNSRSTRSQICARPSSAVLIFSLFYIFDPQPREGLIYEISLPFAAAELLEWRLGITRYTGAGGASPDIGIM